MKIKIDVIKDYCSFEKKNGKKLNLNLINNLLNSFFLAQNQYF